MNNAHTNNIYKGPNLSISSICFSIRNKPLNSIQSEIQFRLLNQFWQQLETVCNSPKARVNTDTSDDLPLVQRPSHSSARENGRFSSRCQGYRAISPSAAIVKKQPQNARSLHYHIVPYRCTAPRCKTRFEVIVPQQYGDDTIPDIVRRVFLVKGNSRMSSPGWNLW